MNRTNSTNNTNNTQLAGQGVGPDMAIRYFFLVYYAVLLVATVSGNLLVCVAIYVDRRLRNATNWLIASLAVADLLYGLITIPFRIVQTSGTRVFTLNECFLWIWVDMVCAAASIANLAVISVDRYLKITKPFQYYIRMTQRRALIAIIGVWLYSATLASLSIMPWPGELGVHLYNGSCTNLNRVFYTVANIVAFILPLIVLVVSYAMVYVEALKQFKKMKNLTVTTTQCSEDKRKQRSVIRDFKATKTLAVVIGTFTICWCPFFLLFTITQYHPTVLDSMPRPLHTFVFVMIYMILPNLNSACNPFIYAYFNSEFRRAFRKIVLRSCPSPRDEYNYDSGQRRRSSVSFFRHHQTFTNSSPLATSPLRRHSKENNNASLSDNDHETTKNRDSHLLTGSLSDNDHETTENRDGKIVPNCPTEAPTC